jgi:hypothetical protein
VCSICFAAAKTCLKSLLRLPPPFPARCKLCCSKPWPYGTATTTTRSRCTDCGPRPVVWRPSWIGCWLIRVEIRPIVGSPSIYSMSGPTPLPFFIVPGWTPPTMSASELSAL